MKKNHKPKKTGTKGKKSSKGRGKKGLHGTNTAKKAMSLKAAAVETGKQAAAVGLGLLISAVGGHALDKITALQPNAADGKMKAILKQAVKPTVLTLTGLGAGTLGRSKGMKFVANIGDGITAGGLFSGVKTIAGGKTQLFNGLGDASELNTTQQANYYQENLDLLAKNLEENGKVLALKGLANAPEENMDGLAEKVIIPGSNINYKNSNSII